MIIGNFVIVGNYGAAYFRLCCLDSALTKQLQLTDISYFFVKTGYNKTGVPFSHGGLDGTLGTSVPSKTLVFHLVVGGYKCSKQDSGVSFSHGGLDGTLGTSV